VLLLSKRYCYEIWWFNLKVATTHPHVKVSLLSWEFFEENKKELLLKRIL
jgi:hypothetical protein